MEAFDGRVLDGPVHAFDLAIGPGVLGPGEAVFDIVSGTGDGEGVCPEWLLACAHLLEIGHSPAVAAGIGEMCAVVGEHGVYLVGDGFEKV